MKLSEMSKEELVNLMEGKGLGGNVRGKKGGGRKEEVLNMLKEELLSIEEIGVKLGISRRNVSSVICYLRDDGISFKEMGNKLVLWSVIRGGKKVGNRMELGEGKEIRFNFVERKFEDEIVKVEVKEDKKVK